MKKLTTTLMAIAAVALLAAPAGAETIAEDFESVTTPDLPSGWQAVGSGVTTDANGNPGNAVNAASGQNYLVNSGVGFDATADISGSFDFYIVESGGFYDNGAFFFGDVQSALGSSAGDHLRIDLFEKSFGARANILDADGTTLFDGSDDNNYEIATDTWYGAEFTWTAATGDFSFSWGGTEGPMTVSSYSLNSSEVFFGFGTVEDPARFDNIEITGTAIPEPTSLGLLGLGGLALLSGRRRRRS